LGNKKPLRALFFKRIQNQSTMKFIKFFFPVLFSLSIVFASCTSADKKQDAAKVDTLLTLLDSASFYLNLLDTQEVKTAFEDYMIHLEDVEAYLIDKPEKEEWHLLGRYGMIRKPLRDYGKTKTRLNNQIEEQKIQLLALKKGRLKGRISPEEFADYFSQERELAIQSRFESFNLYKFTKTYLDEYYLLNKEVIPIIEKLKLSSSR